MTYLVNPSGRIVAVNEDEVEKWIETAGFRRATPDEEERTMKERQVIASNVSVRREVEDSSGVYFSTVSQGGKDGYGVASAKILKGLAELGVKVDTTNNGQKVAILFHNPYSIKRLEAPYRILYTMFESDKLPDDWNDYLEAADLILVPSYWCKTIFQKAGFDAKVVPLGYDDSVFTYKPRPDRLETREDFTFVHYNAFNVRKGFLEVFQAFQKAFTRDEPVKMIFKTTLDQIPLAITKEEYPKIEIIRGKFSENELRDLLYKSDCFVYPSRGEGFGMTPLEAMATGIPAIVPNAHGISEYFDAEFMYEVKVAEMSPAVYSRYKGIDVGKMVTCDVDDLARQMRYVYEHQEEARDMGRRASEYVKNWTFTKTAEKLKEVLDGTKSLKLSERPLKNTLRLEVVR